MNKMINLVYDYKDFKILLHHNNLSVVTECLVRLAYFVVFHLTFMFSHLLKKYMRGQTELNVQYIYANQVMFK